MAINKNDGLVKELFNISAVNPHQTYQYQFRDTFYAIVPPKFKPYYYQVVRRCINWYAGYVPEVHRAQTGMFSSAIGNTIVKEITKLIMGGKLFSQNIGSENVEDDEPNPTLKRFEDWSRFYNFNNIVSRWVEFTSAGGTGCLKLNINSAEDLEAQPMRLDQFFYQTDFSGNCVEFTGFLKSYTAKINRGSGRDNIEENFYILEHRYYTKDRTPVIKIIAKRDYGQVTTSQTFDVSDTREAKWEQLPQQIRENIKKEFGKDIVLDEERELPFNENLGIILANFTNANRTPEIKTGEPALLNVLSYMFDYDYAFSSMITDQYIGRGKVYVPKAFTKPGERSNTFYEGFDDSVITKLAMYAAEKQKPFNVQFNLRSKEWTNTRNMLAENIAFGIGLGGSDLFSYLRDASGTKTATQIASESQKTISFIEEKRNVFTHGLNQFIKVWRDYYNGKDDFKLTFSSGNMVNKLVTVDEVRAMKEVGFSMFDTFSKMYPAVDEAQIWQMVKRSKREKREILEMQAEINSEANMNAFESRMKNINNNPSGKGIQEKDEREELDERETEEKKSKAEKATKFPIFRKKK